MTDWHDLRDAGADRARAAIAAAQAEHRAARLAGPSRAGALLASARLVLRHLRGRSRTASLRRRSLSIAAHSR